MKKIVVIGAGINGLVAANYLAKNNFHVTIIEKKDIVGGACVKDTAVINGKDINYAHGATVLGMMQKFILEKERYPNLFLEPQNRPISLHCKIYYQFKIKHLLLRVMS